MIQKPEKKLLKQLLYAVAEQVTLKRLIRQLTEKSFERHAISSKRKLQGI